jgi:RNase P/RNase MRP subunit p30
MNNFVLTKYSKEIEELSISLGWEKTLFLDRDFVFIETDNKKELLKKIREAKGRVTVFSPISEEMLRFALEKTKVDIVVGVEKIHPKDSLHYVRSGLDQVLCKIAHDQEKTIAFSFNDILNGKDRAKIMSRMKLNLKLCKKYKVKTIFSSFSKKKEELRDPNSVNLINILK